MELRQLEYFVAVAEEANFTRAAARVHVAQPGVSAQVRRLERELGQDLLDRSGRTVRLTAAGAAVLPYARAALSAAAGARLAVDELTGLLRGHVTIGTLSSMASDDLDLPGLIAGFHADHPAVEISLAAANTDDLIEGLKTGRLDMAFISIGATAPAGLGTHVVTSQPFVAAVSHDHALASRSTITLKALAGHALISLPRGTGLRATVDEAFAAAGLRPRVAFEAGDPRVLAQFAARGLGVAIVPQSITDARREQLHAIAIMPALHGRIAFAWRAEGPVSPAAGALIARVRATVAEVPPGPEAG
ncbi:MAG TPA: LysR family transcriptional regulator [Streptosporangiaceae bacterium]|jgi:DNA-binding transcriptional LysR family regulator